MFDLLGSKDDITYSFGWALAQSDDLVRAVLNELFPGDVGSPSAIRLQESVASAGRTDIELETERVHLIIEAKRGWALETETKLTQYTARYEKDTALEAAIVVVSECTPEWALPRLPSDVAGVPVRFLSWQRVAQLVEQTASHSHSHSEKRLLRELHRYMKGLMTMQNVQSNMVYVVSLGVAPLIDGGPSFAAIVTEHDSYFHPVGGGPGGWPRTPPNYLGFRFNGQLQQVRHVDDYEVHNSPWNEIIPGIGEQLDWPEEPHFWYRLGPPIVPTQTVKTGSSIKRSLRVWAAIDLLLTGETISDARDITQARLEAAGEE